jgi:hypothetical protein
MSLHSRLPAEYTLDERVSAVNLLCDKLSQRGAQIERLRWRVAIELYALQQIVLADGLQWEAWCRSHINRSLGDIRKLIKMAKGHDPEVAREAAQHARREENAVAHMKRASVRVVDAEQSAAAARRLVSAILTYHPINEARAMLGLVEMRDLIEALDDAEAASASGSAVRVISTTKH